jgi:hypothetical protein
LLVGEPHHPLHPHPPESLLSAVVLLKSTKVTTISRERRAN